MKCSRRKAIGRSDKRRHLAGEKYSCRKHAIGSHVDLGATAGFCLAWLPQECIEQCPKPWVHMLET